MIIRKCSNCEEITAPGYIYVNADNTCIKCGRKVVPEPKKIEKLDLGVLDNHYAASSLFKIQSKLNEIIDLLNG